MKIKRVIKFLLMQQLNAIEIAIFKGTLAHLRYCLLHL